MQVQVDKELNNAFFFRLDAAKSKLTPHPLGLPPSQQRLQHINRAQQLAL